MKCAPRLARSRCAEDTHVLCRTKLAPSAKGATRSRPPTKSCSDSCPRAGRHPRHGHKGVGLLGSKGGAAAFGISRPGLWSRSALPHACIPGWSPRPSSFADPPALPLWPAPFAVDIAGCEPALSACDAAPVPQQTGKTLDGPLSGKLRHERGDNERLPTLPEAGEDAAPFPALKSGGRERIAPSVTAAEQILCAQAACASVTSWPPWC